MNAKTLLEDWMGKRLKSKELIGEQKWIQTQVGAIKPSSWGAYHSEQHWKISYRAMPFELVPVSEYQFTAVIPANEF